MAELSVLNQPAKPVPKDRLPMPVQLAAGLEKLSLALKSRTWRREGQAGLGPLQRQVLTLLRSKADHSAQVSAIAQELVVRLPTASEAVATLERKRLVKRFRSHRDGRIVNVELTARGARACASGHCGGPCTCETTAMKASSSACGGSEFIPPRR